MIIDDKTIIQAVREKSEVGFRLLMQKYKQPIYWHIRRLVVSHDDAPPLISSRTRIPSEVGFSE